MPDFKALIEQITEDEGFRQDVYECTAGYDTVGIGFALKDLDFTPDEALAIIKWQIDNSLIRMGLEHSQEKVAQLLSKLHFRLAEKYDYYDNLPPMIHSVLINMCYHMGVSGVSKFRKMWANMKDSNWKVAADEMLDSRWAKQTPNRANRLADIVREHG